MKANEDRAEVFPGMVKYGGCHGSIGLVKWKMGAIVIDRDDEHGWRIKMKLDCSETPILSYPFTADTLKRHSCKDTILIDVKRSKDDKDLISFYLKARDKRAAKHIEALCTEVLTKNTAEVINTTPAKSNLITDVGNSSSIVKIEEEISPRSLTRHAELSRMKPNEDRVKVFSGMVKYDGCSGSIGSMKWKMGAILIDKDDKNGWRIKMKLDCSETPILSYPLTADTLQKHICKDTILIDVKRAAGDTDSITFYLKANDKRAAKQIEALCFEVLTKNTADSDKRPQTNTFGRQKSTKRHREDKEDDLYALERKRLLLEIEVLEQKKIHDQQLFVLKKRILEKQLY